MHTPPTTRLFGVRSNALSTRSVSVNRQLGVRTHTMLLCPTTASLQLPRAAASQRPRQSVRACASEPALRASGLDRRTALSWLSLSTLSSVAGDAFAEDSFEPAKKPEKLEYTTLEKSYKEKDETPAGDVGRFAGERGAGETKGCEGRCGNSPALPSRPSRRCLQRARPTPAEHD